MRSVSIRSCTHLSLFRWHSHSSLWRSWSAPPAFPSSSPSPHHPALCHPPQPPHPPPLHSPSCLLCLRRLRLRRLLQLLRLLPSRRCAMSCLAASPVPCCTRWSTSASPPTAPQTSNRPSSHARCRSKRRRSRRNRAQPPLTAVDRRSRHSSASEPFPGEWATPSHPLPCPSPSPPPSSTTTTPSLPSARWANSASRRRSPSAADETDRLLAPPPLPQQRGAASASTTMTCPVG